MIKQLFKIIFRQRKINLFIWAELFLVFIFIWYIVDYMGCALLTSRQDMGFDTEHTYRIELAEQSEDSDNYLSTDKTTTIGEDLLRMVERIRRYPDIQAVSVSIGAQPYASVSFSNKQVYKQIYANDSTGIRAQEFKVSPSFFEVFDIAIGDNKDLLSVFSSSSILLTRQTAEKLFPSTDDALQAMIGIGKERVEKRVVGILTDRRATEYQQPHPCYYTILSDAEIANTLTSATLPNIELCVRVKPQADNSFAARFMNEMGDKLVEGNIYPTDVLSSKALRKSAVSPVVSDINAYLILFVFFLANIFLGVSGTFWHRTRHRRSEIGLRMALGASRREIFKMLISEGILLLVLAAVPAMIICFNLGWMEVVNVYWYSFNGLRFILGISVTLLILSGMIICGIVRPARVSMQIEPAEALMYE